MGPCSEPRICLNLITFRLVTLNQPADTLPDAGLVTSECPSHVIANAAISLYRQRKLWPASSFTIADKSVTLLDKGFFGADLLLRIQAEDTDRHWSSRNGAGIHGTLSASDGDRLLQ